MNLENKGDKDIILQALTLGGRRGGTLGLFGWGCAAGTLEPLAYTGASSSEFCYPILD